LPLLSVLVQRSLPDRIKIKQGGASPSCLTESRSGEKSSVAADAEREVFLLGGRVVFMYIVIRSMAGE
jgi:hypothetical protein